MPKRTELLEHEIREATRARLQRRFTDPSLIVDELGFDDHVARVDLAVINCALHAYEIKSDRDTLGRLPQQLVHYANQFHYTTVVTTERHLDGALQIAGKAAGLIVATKGRNGRITLKQVTRPRKRSLDSSRIVGMMWYEELTEAMRRHGLMAGNSRLNAERRRNLLATHLTPLQLLEELRLAIATRRERQRRERQQRGGGSTRSGVPPHVTSVRPLTLNF